MKILFVIFLSILTCYAKNISLQKPKSYHDQNISGWMMSEKLDGIRGYWNGKHFLTKQGYPIIVPKYFIQNFPNFSLDGELWLSRGSFEKTASIVLDEIPSNEWKKITYNIFEVPDAKGDFIQRLNKAKEWFRNHPNKYVKIIKQIICKDKNSLMNFLHEVEAKGGEGVVVKDQSIKYFSGRSEHILKVKSFKDMEGLVIGINKRKNKYKNMMRSLRLQLSNGIIFNLGNGFTKEERLHYHKIGSYVTFKYYGYTKTHKPKFASYIRTRSSKTFKFK